ncbi:HNH endonuclease [Aliarcobacter cryaerophilus]|uniref:HNH endonuclease n=1 Tax=Aliarcobacter cryaerophilus TaxID=28198 RepID=A0A2S9TEX2_9BACT|nr:HNH endonuclease [Aliarcobacter cryaerophilus]PRM97383.1 HNH endonuclease [Arcobacter cryaerophilus gv. crypticus]
MANNWNIPSFLEQEIRQRDKVCIYCSVPFTKAKISKKTAASWEHIINDAKIITRENIALCCCSCNASKGQKQLSFWLNSKYCKEKNITFETVAQVVKDAINNGQ